MWQRSPLFIYKTLPFLDAIFTTSSRRMGYYSQGPGGHELGFRDRVVGRTGDPAELGIAVGSRLRDGFPRRLLAARKTAALGDGSKSVSRLDVIRSRRASARKNPLQAVWGLGRDLVHMAVFALAGNPPQISVIVMSAALGFVLDLLPARAAGIVPLRLD